MRKEKFLEICFNVKRLAKLLKHLVKLHLRLSSKRTILVFQIEDMVRLFGTFLLLDQIHFPKSELCLVIGSVCQIGALLGTSLLVQNYTN